MNIIQTIQLAIPDIKVIKFKRFTDNRGYFTETYRESDLRRIIPDFNIMQTNESCSTKNVIRGLHFQWNPYMGKLVRTLYGHMIDLVVDIRIDSPNFGKILGYDMPADKNRDYDEWIWVPVGFAHGNIYLDDSAIEYYVTGSYNPECEMGINPFCKEIDWSIFDTSLQKIFDKIKNSGTLSSDKDKKNISLSDWKNNPNNKYFKYSLT
jgi:dTDP-4-dehydrorhamnose 3,5-epimerase